MDEFRMVCDKYPANGHQLHAFNKGSEASAKQAVTDANHNAEVRPDGFYSKVCAPYRPQIRPVVEWEDLT